MSVRLTVKSRKVAVAALIAVAISIAFARLSAQIAGPNVNMVSGQGWPDGDPFLQRQNEPSLAVSTRNPQHLLAGSNDYRTVDLPGLPDGEVTGDAWLGVFKSFDGGNTWKSTLLPGYPQDPSPSPLKVYHAAADPIVRAGSNGLFYYAGIAFNRTEPRPSALFLARLIDNNNKENGDPIALTSLQIVASNPGNAFIDKPALAVDIPRAKAAMCSVATPQVNGEAFTQSFPGGSVYLAYTLGIGDEVDPDFQSQIYFTASPDCGTTWLPPVRLSRPDDRINQGATIAIDPTSGVVYVAWRRFTADGLDNGIVVTRSTDFGRHFGAPGQVRKFLAGTKNNLQDPHFKKPAPLYQIDPFDQPSFIDRFRTNSYPTMIADGDGRVYIVWSERGFAPVAPDPTTGDSRIVMSVTTNGNQWSAPIVVDPSPGRGHQIMPALTFASGKLMVIFYDLRADVSNRFLAFINDFLGIPRRHTIDVRAAQANPADLPVFAPSVQVSQYAFGQLPGGHGLVQLQVNPPNFRLFRQGTTPFLGDYIDIASLMMKPAPKGGWIFNTAATPAPVFHAAWTDNRDVRPPLDGDWTHYTPPISAFHPGAGSSLFDPTIQTPACAPGQTGMRNQNIYGAHITAGLIVGSPGNSKPLSATLQRAFVIFAQNTTNVVRTFRLTIQDQPAGGRASFVQFPLPPYTASSPAPVTTIDVQIAARSSISRSVFVTSSDPHAQVTIAVAEVTGLGGALISGGLQDSLVLNPDISNPDISNPDISNPDISNANISNTEVFNPDISNPDISNPDISNPDISNPDISNPDISNVVLINPDISNPDISNPDISNPDISNPDISNPDISNPDISNVSLTDVSWTITNNGNTAGSFDVKLVLNQATVPIDFVFQLILHRLYKVPVADGCYLKYQTQNVLIANIPRPVFTSTANATNSDPTNGSLSNATLWLKPGESAKITLRVLDPNKHDNKTFHAETAVVPAALAQAVNSDAAAAGSTTPEVGLPPGVALPFVVTTASDSGPGSLREALTTVNATMAGTPHVIFNIPGPAPYVISLATPLPTMTKKVYIDGTTQPGYAGTPVVRINGSAAGAGAHGLWLTAGGSTVAGLSIGGFDGSGIRIETGGNNQIVGNYIGVDTTGGVATPNGTSGFAAGVAMVNSSNNVIGGLTAQMRNVISGNGTPSMPSVGVGVIGSGTGNLIEGNYIGTDATGTIAMGNAGPGIGLAAGSNVVGGSSVAARNVIAGNERGVDAHGDGAGLPFPSDGSNGNLIQNNYIGTDATGTVDLGNRFAGVTLTRSSSNIVQSNLISGNGNPATFDFAKGVIVDGTDGPATGNQVIGNYIGTNVTGTGAIPNSVGVNVVNASSNTIGGTTPGAGNVISGNDNQAIFITGNSSNNQILGNRVGTNPAGTAAIPNHFSAVQILTSAGQTATGNIIGGATVAARNIISGNFNPTFFINGVSLFGPGTTGNYVLGNYVGTDVTGTIAMGNVGGGVQMDGASGNFVGGIAPGEGNLISGNTRNGVNIRPGATNNHVLGNIIGLNTTGLSALGNGGSGINLDSGANNNTIGDALPGGRNVISGNVSNGINIQANGTIVIGNYIGTNTTGTAAIGNQFSGVNVNNELNTIGSPGAGNVISGNNGSGISLNTRVSPPTSGSKTTIQANFIGTNAGGTSALANTSNGISVNTNANVIGGSSASSRNVISKNGSNGIGLFNSGASSNQIKGNYIGTDVTGTVDLGNQFAGISINNAPNNIIGGTNAGEGNVISGSTNGNGVSIVGATTTGNQVFGNRIGSNAAGTAGLPNAFGGIFISAPNNQIGDTTGATLGGPCTGGCNLIAFNNGSGISITNNNATATGNVIKANSIFSNSSLGINLGNDFITFNDPGDGDTGPNNLQNFPVVTAADTTHIQGTLNSTASTTFSIQFFSNTSCDPSGYGEGMTWASSASVTTDGSGNGVFNVPVTLPSGVFVTGTATGVDGTSEFSQCVANAPMTLTVNSTADSGPGSLRQAILDSNIPGYTDTIAFNIPGGGVHTITPSTQLPTITNPAVIDGFTQPGSSPNTNPIEQADNAVYAIELSGASLGGGNGLNINGGGSTVRGLVINRFNGSAIGLNTAGGNTIAGNFLGTNTAGTAAAANNTGVFVGSATNTIGGTTADARNVISGNTNSGINVTNPSASGNTIAGNFIGTNAAGTGAVPNNGGGVFIFDAPNNVVGGTAAGARNVISGNSNNGVGIARNGATGNQILGNYIGTKANGLEALGNNSGIWIGAPNNIVGGTTAAARNVISGNSMWSGVNLSADVNWATDTVYSIGSGNLVAGNYIGVKADGSAPLGNGSGVSVQAPNNTIGGTAGTTPGGACTGACNVIAGSTFDGVQIGTSRDMTNHVTFSMGTGAVVQGNFIGTNPTGTMVMANGQNGVTSQVAGAMIGGVADAARNVISGNTGSGISLFTFFDGATLVSSATGTVVLGNYVGMNTAGTALLKNGQAGINISTAGNFVGVTSDGLSIRGNTIVGNGNPPPGWGGGVSIDGSAANGNQVKGNYIGTTAAGTGGFGNLGPGVSIGDASNTIVGGAGAARNVIAGNTMDGISVYANSAAVSGIEIVNNYIGVKPDGVTALGNGQNGVHHSVGSGSLAGTFIHGNVISANTGNGISGYGTSGTTVAGNFIGTNATGTAPLGNGSGGIGLGSVSNSVIGGTTAAARNIVSGNGSGTSGPGIGIWSGPAAGQISDNIQILGNYVGTDVTGMSAIPNVGGGVSAGASGSGVTSNITIGGAAAGAGNLISGNLTPGCCAPGISINNVSSVTIQGNKIGTNATGTAALANTHGGINLGFVTGGLVGGTASGAGNLISGNGTATTFSPGINVYNGSGITFQGNLIGTDVNGTAVLPNADGGIQSNGSSNNTIGGASAGARNVISGNGAFGKTPAAVGLYSGTTGTHVEGNWIGVDASGNTPLGNTGGINIVNSSGDTIGGSAAGQGNVIAASGTVSAKATGIYISNSPNTVVKGNRIGTSADGLTTFGNTGDGVYADSASNTIGGTGPNDGNLISGNAFQGVNLSNASSNGNVVQGNLIGLNANGNAAIGMANGQNGVLLWGGAHDNTIGGAAAGARNVIGGHTVQGISINGSSNNTIQGNYVGVDASGATAVANSWGIGVGGGGGFNADNNVIGGAVSGAGNVISGNTNAGIGLFDSNVHGTTIQGNIIGLTPTGNSAMANGNNGTPFGGNGIQLNGASSTLIGGPVATPAARNVVSGNVGNGIAIGGGSTGTVVKGNFIGTNAAGTGAIPNTAYGVSLFNASSNTIGGTTADANVISGNGNFGIWLVSSPGQPTDNNVIRGNFIGTDASGTGALGNMAAGIMVDGNVGASTANTQIGGSSTQANVIAFNAGVGVGVRGPTALGAKITDNSIFGNGSIGIDLLNDGVTPNDPLDADTGPNQLQNFPGIANVTATSVQAELFSTPSTTITVQFFQSPTSSRQGKVLVATVTQTTDPAGHANYTASGLSLTSGWFVTSTATDVNGNTSEFSDVSAAVLP